jgi:amylosucrase
MSRKGRTSADTAKDGIAGDARLFDLRLRRSEADLFGMLEPLYGQRPDYPAFRDALLDALRRGWQERPEALKWLDLERDLEPDWFQRPTRPATFSTSTASPAR